MNIDKIFAADRLRLDKVHQHPDMSEETPAFSAEILFDGKNVGSVRNDGQGGCHIYNFHTREDAEAVMIYLGGLPPLTFGDMGYDEAEGSQWTDVELPGQEDARIDCAMIAWEAEQEAKKHRKIRVPKMIVPPPTRGGLIR